MIKISKIQKFEEELDKSAVKFVSSDNHRQNIFGKVKNI